MYEDHWQPFEKELEWPADGNALLTKDQVKRFGQAMYDCGRADGIRSEREAWNALIKSRTLVAGGVRGARPEESDGPADG